LPSTGALLDYARGDKHQHELGLLRRLMHMFNAGDLVLADRGFSTYTLLALLLVRGVHSLFRLHQARPADLRKGKRLGKKDRLFIWEKPLLRPRYLPKAIWKAIPKQLSVRVLRFSLQVPGFRVQSVTLVTTLLDAATYPATALADLYYRRWQVELNFRHIKITMKMDVLRCETVEGVLKELAVFALALVALLRRITAPPATAGPAVGGSVVS
jgi:hypothetical protein